MDTANLLLVLLLVMVSPLIYIIECVNDHHVLGAGEMAILCIEKERQGLLRFKQGFTDDNGILASWDDEDCCKWDGIWCSDTSHHVIALQIWTHERFTLKGSLSDALLDLHHLQKLMLSNVDLMGSKIPSFIGSLEKLEHLILERCELSGVVPSQLGNLTKLNTLNLGNNNGLEVNNLDWLYHLHLLSQLDLSDTKVGDPNWLHAISSLHSLKELDLSNCDLPQLTQSSLEFSVNSSLPLPSLAKVNLSYNNLTSLIFSWLVNFNSSLVNLDLSSNNKLDTRIPEPFENFNFLEYPDISRNKFDGEFLRSLSKLKTLDMSYSMFEGNISESHLSNLSKLKTLDLSFNSLALNLISADWIPPFQLQELKLAGCRIGPHFPNWIKTQNNISHLDLSSGGILGPLPEWLSNMPPVLQYLNLSYNQLSGSFPDLSSSFADVSTVDISFNKCSGFLPLFHPYSVVLQLSTNMFTGPISSICTYENLVLLDLYNNQLFGDLPPCWMNMTVLFIFDLANNTISGKIDDALGLTFPPDGLKALVLRNNNLSGEIPILLMSQSNLMILDLGGNHLTGTIPVWMGTHLPSLKVLSLRENKFHGIIPPEMCHLTNIQILDLSGNNMSGRIPKCFSNFTYLTQYDGIPGGLMGPRWGMIVNGYLYTTESYVENAYINWKRKDTEYRRNARFLKLIDLSNNKLAGNIPKDFSLLRELVSLNLSINQLTGSIDPDIGQMQNLESLVLSGNHLCGEIPVGLAQLAFLAVLDLSNNNLSGRIPPGTQLQGFNTSTYAGNNGLCGLPLAPCPILVYPQTSLTENQKQDYLDSGFYICAACGFVMGFWGVIIIFFFTSSLRNALFNSWN